MILCMTQPAFSETRYASDLTDAEWELLAPMIPPPPEGYTRTVEMRAILNGIFYKLRAGCPWRYLPSDLPNWRVVYDYFQRFQRSGLWEQINHRLREHVRVAAGRAPTPTAAIIDSQSVKGTEKRGSRDMTVVKS
jgi:putative transposase